MSTILTGIRPTGGIQLGNYFSAIKPIIELQKNKNNRVILFIADLHALVNMEEKTNINENTYRALASYIALGIDPKRCLIFRQSDIPEVTELFYIFSTLLTTPQLELGHAYKDNKKHKDLGLLVYPVLMTADIVLYDGEIVPVGKDQKQHIEMTREIVRKFNNKFGEVFKEPEGQVNEVEIVGLDGRKMSKSYGNSIDIFESGRSIQEKIKIIKTTSTGKGEGINIDDCNVSNLRKLFMEEKEFEKLREQCLTEGISYKESKEALFRELIDFFGEARSKYDVLLKDRKKLDRILKKGGKEASSMAKEKMEKIKEACFNVT